MNEPLKIYFDRTLKTVRLANGSEVANDEARPSATLTQKFWINIQVVTDGLLTKYTGYEVGAGANVLVDNDFKNAAPIIPLAGGDGDWTAGTGSEYYFNGTGITEDQESAYEGGEGSYTALTKGTVGALAAGEWGWDSVNTRLYVRLSDSTDPDTKATGWVAIKPVVTDATDPFIEVDGSTFNAAGSWYDEVTKTFRNPDITAGELSFYANANTVQFYNRIGSSGEDLSTKMYIYLLESGSAELFEGLEFFFVTKNIVTGTGLTLELAGSNYYTKGEILALLAGYLKISLTGTQITLTDDGVANDVPLGAAVSYRTFKVECMVESGSNYYSFKAVVTHNGTSTTLKLSDEDGFNLSAFYESAGFVISSDYNSGSPVLRFVLTSFGDTPKLVYSVIRRIPIAT